jgi:hypothetical protein
VRKGTVARIQKFILVMPPLSAPLAFDGIVDGVEIVRNVLAFRARSSDRVLVPRTANAVIAATQLSDSPLDDFESRTPLAPLARIDHGAILVHAIGR